MTREHELGQASVDLADTTASDLAVLQSLVVHCVCLLDISAAGVIGPGPDGGNPQVLASSTDQVGVTELFGLEAAEGLGLECIRTCHPVTVADLDDTGSQWPRFAATARRNGFAAVHTLPMCRRGEVIGGLSLLRAHPGELTPEDRDAAQALADLATVVILNRRRTDQVERLVAQLQGALRSRIVIEQAKGVLSVRGNIPMEDTFNTLRRYARSNNLRLTQLAHDVISGAIDLTPLLAARPEPARRPDRNRTSASDARQQPAAGAGLSPGSRGRAGP